MTTAIQHSLHFLVLEVDRQLENLQAFFETGSATLARRILDRTGYTRNLEARLHETCRRALASPTRDGLGELSLRAYEVVARELGHIAELGRACIQHLAGGKRQRSLDPEALGPLIDRVREGVVCLEQAIERNETREALALVEIEQGLDDAYERLLQGHIAELGGRCRHPKHVVAALFVAHHVEQMGDGLLRACEAILSANLGQPLDISRYQALAGSLAKLGDEDLEELQLDPLAITRSGGTVAGVTRAEDEEGRYVAVWKEGEKRKLKDERRRVRSWHAIYPGLAPRILSYEKRGQSASLLIEHLAGLTIEQILIRESKQLLSEALEHLSDTLRTVWTETRSNEPVCAEFVQQTQKRMAAVYAVHPEFQRSDAQICGTAMPSFDTLMARAGALEEELRAPFSVYIHGDFNVDNIIYDPLEQRINFIDLHRSHHMDYVQDVSVFMVSNYRLQILDAPVRRRILRMARRFYRFAAGFAADAGDEGFELRLALGLARSFATSTRFILDKSLARRMFHRARFLTEAVLDADLRKPRRFKVPVKELFRA